MSVTSDKRAFILYQECAEVFSTADWSSAEGDAPRPDRVAGGRV